MTLQGGAPVLILYAHPLSSYCWKVLTAFYELGMPFDYRLLAPEDTGTARELHALWPIGRFPVLRDEGRTIAESSVIIEYIDLRHGGPLHLLPADPAAALDVRMRDRFFDNYVMTPMQAIVFNRIRPAHARDPYGVAQARTLIDTAYRWLDGEMETRLWAAGARFSLADCAAAPALSYADRVQPMAGRFPHLAAYLARLTARPSFARVLKEAEPYADMFPRE